MTQREDTLSRLAAASEPDQDWNEDLGMPTMIPCVVCSIGPQYGGSGFCSVKCAEDLFEMYPEPPC